MHVQHFTTWDSSACAWVGILSCYSYSILLFLLNIYNREMLGKIQWLDTE